MELDELKKRVLNHEFTHIKITNLSNKIQVTRRIIKVEPKGVHSFHYLWRDLNIFRPFPNEAEVNNNGNGYIEKITTSNRGIIKTLVEFVKIEKNNRS